MVFPRRIGGDVDGPQVTEQCRRRAVELNAMFNKITTLTAEGCVRIQCESSNQLRPSTSPGGSMQLFRVSFMVSFRLAFRPPV